MYNPYGLFVRSRHIYKEFFKPASRSRHQFSKAFTIVELLIVIVIIAILATITIVAYNGIQERANSATTISQAKEYIQGLKLWGAESGRPTTSSCIVPSATATCPSAHYWSANPPIDTTFITNLNKYSGIADAQLGKYGPSNPVGLMWYHQDYFGDRRGVLTYHVGPNSDCGLPDVLTLTPGADNLTLTGAPYTLRTSAYTLCMIEVFKW